MGRDLNRHFFQRRHIDGQQAREKTLNSPHHQGNANPNHMNYHPTAVRMARIKKIRNRKYW